MNSPADIQDRIASARKEAEGLKEKIKRKKEQLADTDCRISRTQRQHLSAVRDFILSFLADEISAHNVAVIRFYPEDRYEGQTNIKGTSGEDLCDALGHGSSTPRLRIPGRKAHHLGRIHDQQNTRYPPAVFMGHDLCLRAVWQHGCMWRP